MLTRVLVRSPWQTPVEFAALLVALVGLVRQLRQTWRGR
jgi:hypothetical protein